MKTSFVTALDTLMERHDDIITVTTDMGYSLFEGIQKKYKDRFINTGVTEQATTGFASGLASCGYTVFYFAQAIFITTRCYEQMRLDVAYSQANVKMIGSNAGFSLNQYGLSHFAVEDVAIMRLLSGMTVLTPGDPYEMEWAMNEAYKIKGPVYIRYTKMGGSRIHKQKPKIELGKQILINEGRSGTLLVSGSLLEMATEIVKLLHSKGVSLKLYSVCCIKPFDKDSLVKEAKLSGAIFTLEEHCVNGGLGTIVAEILAEERLSPVFYRFGLPDRYTSITGSMEYLLSHNGVSAEKISNKIIDVLA